MKIMIDSKTRKEITLDDFTVSYCEAALWTSTDDNDQPLDRNYDIEDIDVLTLLQMHDDCRKFQEENAHHIESGYLPDRMYEAWDMAGYHFWMTRNGHGTGFTICSDFWKDEQGEKLYEASHKFGEYHLGVSSGKVYGAKG